MQLQQSNTSCGFLMILCLWYHQYYRGGSYASALFSVGTNIAYGAIVALRGADTDSEKPLHKTVNKVRWAALCWLVYEMGNVPGVVY